MQQKSQFTKEVQDRAVRTVLDQMPQYPSQWATILSIAPKIGCSPQTLRKWVKRHEIDSGEVRELRQVNEILRKASAFFARAELDRKPRR